MLAGAPADAPVMLRRLKGRLEAMFHATYVATISSRQLAANLQMANLRLLYLVLAVRRQRPR